MDSLNGINWTHFCISDASMIVNKPQMSRCPACNPIHVGLGSIMRGKIRSCMVCKNTRMIPVEAASAYVNRLYGGGVNPDVKSTAFDKSETGSYGSSRSRNNE